MGPSAASPAMTCAQRSPPTVSATGYLVVNQPTVRDRSMSGARSSSRPWPSTSMPIGAASVPQEFGAGQPERDQQDVLHPGVKRGGDLTEQQAGGLDIQRHRQVPGAGVGVQLGLQRRQRGRGRGYLFPGVGLIDHRRGVGVLGEQ